MNNNYFKEVELFIMNSRLKCISLFNDLITKNIIVSDIIQLPLLNFLDIDSIHNKWWNKYSKITTLNPILLEWASSTGEMINHEPTALHIDANKSKSPENLMYFRYKI